MGRPSKMTERRAELLDVADDVILRDGVRGLTIAAIARDAGVQTSLVHHYMGSRDDLLAAALDRVLGRVEELVVHALVDVEPSHRLDAQLDVLFGPALDDPGIEQIVEQLISASYADDRLRHRLAALYGTFERILAESIRAAHPGADEASVGSTAHAVLALAHASPTFAFLGLRSDGTTSLRAAAEQLLEGLS